VALSGLVGAATHVFLDGFTHGNHSGWALALIPALATPVPQPWGTQPLHDALQVWLTVALGALALHEWDRTARALPPAGPGAQAAWEVRPAPPAACRRVVALLLGAALFGALAAPVLTGALGSPDALKLSVYGAITFSAAAALVGAAAARLRRALDAARPAAAGTLGA
jgi:hypothetical protein